MPDGDVSLDFVCPTCGADPHEKCVMGSGTARSESHVERLDIAKDYLRRVSFREKSPLSHWMDRRAQS